MTMRNMTEEELRIAQALSDGDIKPLGALLARESPDVHPVVQRALRRLIEGDSTETDYRMIVTRHPALKGKRSSLLTERVADQNAIEVALTYAKHGGFIHGSGKHALEETKRIHGIGRTEVTDAWSAFKVWVARAVQHGHAELPDQFRPSDAQFRRIIRTSRKSARTVD